MTSPNAHDPESREESETGRLEAFSDGVLAVIVTIMALELKAPAVGSFTGLRARLPALLIYILSFTFIGMYWNNHHHLLRAARRVTGGVIWANLHLLFWLSLIPVLTAWIGEHYRQPAPAATDGLVCLGAAVAYGILTRAIIRADGSDSPVAAAIGRDVKGRASLVLRGLRCGRARSRSIDLRVRLRSVIRRLGSAPSTRAASGSRGRPGGCRRGDRCSGLPWPRPLACWVSGPHLTR